MKIKTVIKEKTYIPEWNGNKDLPAQEQIRAHFDKLPAAGEKTKYMSVSFSNSKGATITYDDPAVIMRFAAKHFLDNLEINGKVITTAEDLLNYESTFLTPLVSELRNYILGEDDEITEGESEASK